MLNLDPLPLFNEAADLADNPYFEGLLRLCAALLKETSVSSGSGEEIDAIDRLREMREMGINTLGKVAASIRGRADRCGQTIAGVVADQAVRDPRHEPRANIRSSAVVGITRHDAVLDRDTTAKDTAD